MGAIQEELWIFLEILNTLLHKVFKYSQDSNLAPVANAGPDFTITLPQSIVVVNGSGSHDDLKIVR